MSEQIKDILPSFLLSITMGMIIFLAGIWLPYSQPIILIIQIVSGAFITVLFCEATKLNSYIYLKEIAKTQLQTYRNGRK